MQLLLLQTRELCQAHFDDGLRLHLVEFEAVHQSLLGFGGCLAGADEANYLVDVVRGNDEAFQNVGTLLRFAQFELRAANDDIVAVLHEDLYAVFQRQRLGASVYEAHAVDGKGTLQGRHLEELVQDDVGVGVALHVHHDAHTFAVAFVVDVADAVYLLLANERGNVSNKFGLVDAVRYFADNDGIVRRSVFDVGFSAYDDASAARFVGRAHAL